MKQHQKELYAKPFYTFLLAAPYILFLILNILFRLPPSTILAAKYLILIKIGLSGLLLLCLWSSLHIYFQLKKNMLGRILSCITTFFLLLDGLIWILLFLFPTPPLERLQEYPNPYNNSRATLYQWPGSNTKYLIGIEHTLGIPYTLFRSQCRPKIKWIQPTLIQIDETQLWVNQLTLTKDSNYCLEMDSKRLTKKQ